MPSPPRPLPLTLPFGVVGLAAGFVVQMLAHGSGIDTSAAIVALTGLFATFLGRFLSARAAASAWPWLLVLFATPLMGAGEGALLMSAGLGRQASVAFTTPAERGWGGAVAGGLIAVALVPAFVAVVYAARRIGTARAGSLIDGVYRRGVWVVTTAASAAIIIAAFAMWQQIDAKAVLVVASACSLALAIAFLVNVDATVKLVRYRPPTRPRTGAAPLVVDYGVGDEVEERANTSYRQNAREVIVFRGTRDRALRALLRAAAATGLAFAAVLGSAVLVFVR